MRGSARRCARRCDFPATGYGYIRLGRKLKGAAAAFRVKRFVEKPDRARAEAYLRAGDHLWNGGMFVWRLDAFLAAMRKYSPQIAKLDLGDLARSYRRLKPVSIDVALMEKAPRIAVCRTRMDWCDVGNWYRFYEKAPRDRAGVAREGVVRADRSRDSLLVNRSARPLLAAGVSGLIVVQTEQGTLVCPRGQAEEAARLLKTQ